MSGGINESTVEEAALSWFGELGYATVNGQAVTTGWQGQSDSNGPDFCSVAGRRRRSFDGLLS
jgi:hypothetical protein